MSQPAAPGMASIREAAPLSGPQDSGEAKLLPCAPSHCVGESGAGEGWRERCPCPALRAVWVIVPRWGLSTPVSFRYALRGLHPHSWDAWRPRVHLLHPDSITCQIPSVSPRAETLSTHLLPLHTCLAPVQILKLGRVELSSVRANGAPPANTSSIVRALECMHWALGLVQSTVPGCGSLGSWEKELGNRSGCS